MNKNYRLLSESVRTRINPENFIFQKSFSDELATLSYNDVLTYVRLAMKGVEPEYTRRSREAGDKVKEHLGKVLRDVTYKYQGSVMTDTHIKGYSDIDLLAICDKFYHIDRTNISNFVSTPENKLLHSIASINKLNAELASSSYTGDSIQDLRNLRLSSETSLSAVYTTCDVRNPKAIKIENLSLKRKVDVVIASWFDDILSIINNKGEYRGIQVYNKDTNSKESPDFPFLSIERINQRSADTNGRLKKMIRFLKNTKENSTHTIDLNSFEINAICYDIAPTIYQTLPFYKLVPVLFNQLSSLATSRVHSDKLVSVDGREYVFANNLSKLDHVKLLMGEVEGVCADIKKIPQLV